MKLKSLLLVAAVASSVAGSAFANNYDFATASAMSQRAAAQTKPSASTAPSTLLGGEREAHGNITPFALPATDKTLTRAQVRADTIKYLSSPEARMARALEVGSAM